VKNIPEVEMQRGTYSKYHSTESNVAYMGWSEKFKNRSNLTPCFEISKYRSSVSFVPPFAWSENRTGKESCSDQLTESVATIFSSAKIWNYGSLIRQLNTPRMKKKLSR